MKKSLVDKRLSSAPRTFLISEKYDQEARQFQRKYNREHPDRHIWRHLLYKRTFFFCKEGKRISVKIEIVRFIFAGTNRTMTFYGSMFLPRSSFSKQFQKHSVSNPSAEFTEMVSIRTIQKWALDLKLHKSSRRNALHDIS